MSKSSSSGHADSSSLNKRKEKFVKYILARGMRPVVDSDEVLSAGAFIDFDNGMRCAICDLCGLHFWWENESLLKIIFESMSEDREVTVYEDRRTRRCEAVREKARSKVKVMSYGSFLDFMTTVAEKNMNLRDWRSHRGIQKYLRDNRGSSLPVNRGSLMPPIRRANAAFDYQVSTAIGMVDRMFMRGSLEGTTKFPEKKVEKEVPK